MRSVIFIISFSLLYDGYKIAVGIELYVKTQRIDLAKERLSVLKNCNCEEYEELKEVIEKN